jgi:hypothetical protein
MDWTSGQPEHTLNKFIMQPRRRWAEDDNSDRTFELHMLKSTPVVIIPVPLTALYAIHPVSLIREPGPPEDCKGSCDLSQHPVQVQGHDIKTISHVFLDIIIRYT